MRFASLGSGSRGNALVVEAGGTRLLMDCGFGPRELAARLDRLDLTPADLHGIVVTHEHGDHLGGVAACSRRYGLRVFLSHGTLSACPNLADRAEVIDSHAPFALDGIEVLPYPVPHDAREPVQFVFADGRHRLGVLTDTGWVTPHIAATLAGCDALVLECNHDSGMLAAGRYPRRLKERIAGRFGHLDNDAAAGLLAGVADSRLRHVVAAHLSEENNTPALARAALAGALGGDGEDIVVASQERGFGWLELA